MAKFKTNKRAGIAGVVIAILSVIALVIGLCSDWYSKFWIWNSDPATEIYAPNANMEITQTQSDNIMLYTAPMAMSAYVRQRSATALSAIEVTSLTATIEPANATLQKVDYTAEWANPGSAWANGKLVESYLKLTQATDGALTCTVELFQPIGEVIVITCKARPLQADDYTPSAQCTVNYFQRITGLAQFEAFGGEYTTDMDGEDYLLKNYSYNFLQTPTIKLSNEKEDAEQGLTIIPQYGTGTKKDQPMTTKAYVKFKDNIATELAALGLNVNNRAEFGEVPQWKDCILSILGNANLLDDKAKCAEIYSILSREFNAGRPTLEIIASFTAPSGKIDREISNDALFNPLGFGVRAQNVNLSDNNFDL